jgi:type II secretory pathway pseudopilin PulG
MTREPQTPREARSLDPPRPGGRASFTLLELLISLGIILILAALTMQLLNSTLNSDRIRNGARELQSFFAGARDRAIHSGQPRGVRLITDIANPTTVRSFVYVGASSTFTDGTPLVIDPLGNVTNAPVVWQNLWNRGLLTDGTPIQLIVGATPIVSFMTLSATGMSAAGPTGFAITTAPAGQFPIANPPGAKYTLQLAPTVLSGDEPRTLPSNIVVDLNSSILPLAWGSNGSYTNSLDIMFSPQGGVVGPTAADGKIHLVLADTSDTTGETAIASLPARSPLQLNAPWQPGTVYGPGNVIVPTPSSFIAFRCVTGGTSGVAAAQPTWPTQPNQSVTDNGILWQSFAKKTNLIVSLATATGRVTTHPVDVSTQLIPAGTGYDSFRFAEVGEVQQ